MVLGDSLSSKFDDYLINEKKRRFLDTVKVASWTPPSGVVHTYAGREEPKPTKEKSRKVDKSRCNYHLCRKKRELENCPYCSGYYCEEHLMAIRPRMMNFESNSLDDIEARRNTEGHPCPAYAEMLIEKKKQETENYKRALDRLSGKSSSVSGYTKTEHHDDVKTPYYDDKVGGIEHKEGDSKLKAIFFVIFVITASLVFLYLWNSNQEEPAAVFPGNAYLNCSRIGHLTCSDTKPLYCKNGTVISLCQVCGCPAGFICDADGECTQRLCADSTKEGQCSITEPFECIDGNLIKNPKKCGCPDGYYFKDNECIQIRYCGDYTLYGSCSTKKPLYCQNGTLVPKASVCGCPENYNVVDDECNSSLRTGAIERGFRYTLDGSNHVIKIFVYEGLDDYLAGLPRTYYCTGGVCPSDSELQLRFLNEDHQRDELLLLVDAIESRTENKDDQARIAISLVQNIPYDKVAADTDNLENRYPYEVLFDNKGVCEEKSRLLAFLLREFGYGAVLFSYERENHMAVGIKCPEQYSLSNMGYCFIETTNPSIITDNMGQYREIGYLRSDPTRIVINDGESFASVSREYNDAKRLEELIWTASTKAGYLDSGEYEEWQKLVTKYGIVPT